MESRYRKATNKQEKHNSCWRFNCTCFLFALLILKTLGRTSPRISRTHLRCCVLWCQSVTASVSSKHFVCGRTCRFLLSSWKYCHQRRTTLQWKQTEFCHCDTDRQKECVLWQCDNSTGKTQNTKWHKTNPWEQRSKSAKTNRQTGPFLKELRALVFGGLICILRKSRCIDARQQHTQVVCEA